MRGDDGGHFPVKPASATINLLFAACEFDEFVSVLILDVAI